ncbi:MAG: addiction module protein [Candidatus Kapaibacterium sp.]
MRPWEQSVFELPAEEKIKLIRALWASVESEVLGEKYPVPEEDIIEIKKRMDEYLRDGDPGETWDVVKARILAKLDREYDETESRPNT